MRTVDRPHVAVVGLATWSLGAAPGGAAAGGIVVAADPLEAARLALEAATAAR